VRRPGDIGNQLRIYETHQSLSNDRLELGDAGTQLGVLVDRRDRDRPIVGNAEQSFVVQPMMMAESHEAVGGGGACDVELATACGRHPLSRKQVNGPARQFTLAGYAAELIRGGARGVLLARSHAETAARSDTTGVQAGSNRDAIDREPAWIVGGVPAVNDSECVECASTDGAGRASSRGVDPCGFRGV
jgi:hypothetical protein